MIDDLAFPTRPDELTADWMTDALREATPDAEVTGVEVLEQHSGTTGRVRLRLDHAQPGSGPASVFVKLPPFDEAQQKLVAATDMGRREARFYAGPAAEVPLRIPEPYFAAVGDAPTEYVMVLEDLVASGCTFTTRLDPPTVDHGTRIVEGLARLHAHFWEDERFDEELAWVQPAMRGAFGARLIDDARNQFASELPPAFDALCHLYVEHHEEIAEVLDDGEQTLVHGDTHSGNQFSDGADAGLYDWAVISRSPGIRDLAIYLGNSCPTEMRRTEEEGWIRRYHDLLVDAGVDAPELDVLWTRYRRSVIYAWVAATTTAAMGSRWQPVEVGRLGMERATRACADLDTVDAIRAEL